MTNLGRWAPWYERMTPADAARMYSATETYDLAADFLDGLAVEDWGCGFATYRDHHRGPYLGVDGTPGWCDVVDDLATRVSSTPAVMMRHVLEHNTEWLVVLGNAVASARQRIVIVVFTPDGMGEQIGWTDELGVPDLAIPHSAVDAALADWSEVDKRVLVTRTAYGQETVWMAVR